MSNTDTMKQFIKQVSGQANILAIPRVYIAMMNNDLEVALFLSQAVYWSDKSKDPDGWFYKSAAEWNDETGLSKHQITRCTNELEKLEIVATKIKKANGAPTKHFRVNLDNLMNSVFCFLENQETGNQICRKPEMESKKTSKSLTETTTETTKEKVSSGGICEACGEETGQLIQASYKGTYFKVCSTCDIRGTLPPALRPSKNGHAARIDAALVGGTNFHMNVENDCQQFLKFSPNWNNKTERELMAFLKERVRAGQTVRQFSLWYSQNHWKGKQGQPPTSKDIRETWYAAFPDTVTVTTDDGGLYV